ncbi:helix-turn-helix domain-containing protein [Burkholderia sp. Bmkn7]|uniref:helix-turn-helix domain-containing protein n=1 Tax=Burkholderia sp. Bmkn7 TaxID=3236841 RepID=UPI0034E49A5D
MTKPRTFEDLRAELMKDPEAREAYVAQGRMVRLGQLLRSVRKERGLTQRDVHDRTGIDQADLSRIENGEGERGPTFDTMIKYAHALDLELCIALTPRGTQRLAHLALESRKTRRDAREELSDLDMVAMERF